MAPMAFSNRSTVINADAASTSTAPGQRAYALNKKLFTKPMTWKLGRKDTVPRATLAKPPWATSLDRQACKSPAWVMGTPLGRPVDPDVNMTTATSRGPACIAPEPGLRAGGGGASSKRSSRRCRGAPRKDPTSSARSASGSETTNAAASTVATAWRSADAGWRQLRLTTAHWRAKAPAAAT